MTQNQRIFLNLDDLEFPDTTKPPVFQFHDNHLDDASSNYFIMGDDGRCYSYTYGVGSNINGLTRYELDGTFDVFFYNPTEIQTLLYTADSRGVLRQDSRFNGFNLDMVPWYAQHGFQSVHGFWSHEEDSASILSFFNNPRYRTPTQDVTVAVDVPAGKNPCDAPGTGSSANSPHNRKRSTRLRWGRY